MGLRHVLFKKELEFIKMADFNKFNQLLQNNDYTILEYFSYHKYCTFVKIINTLTGNIYFINISKTYKLLVPSDLINHYVLRKEDTKSKEFTSVQLSGQYPSIQLDQNISSEQIKTTYKQPIQIQNNTASDYLEQMKRLRYCFKLLEHKLIIQSDQYLIFLNFENTIEIYRIETHPRTDLISFYIIISLENFYSRLNTICETITQIETEFYEILNINQSKHIQYLNSNQLYNFVSNNTVVLDNKTRLQNVYNEICTLIKQVQEKETKCLNTIKELRSQPSNNIFKDAEIAKKRDELERAYRQIHDTKIQLLEKVLRLNSNIKHIYLNIDTLGFNLSIAFSDLKNEFDRLLEISNEIIQS